MTLVFYDLALLISIYRKHFHNAYTNHIYHKTDDIKNLNSFAKNPVILLQLFHFSLRELSFSLMIQWRERWKMKSYQTS